MSDAQEPTESPSPSKSEGDKCEREERLHAGWGKFAWLLVAAIIGAVASILVTRIWDSIAPSVQFTHELNDTSCKVDFFWQPHRCDSNYWELNYLGPAELEDYWIRESIYWVEGRSVSECPDLPHFEYYYYEGNSRSMGTLKKGQGIRYFLRPCWHKFMEHFSEASKGHLLSRITLTGSAEHAPEFEKEWFFVLGPSECQYQNVTQVAGGAELVNRVQEYLSHGPRSVIRYMEVRGRSGYFRNPPEMWYWSDSAQSDLPWYGKGFPPSGVARQYPEFNPGAFTPTGKQSISLQWDCETGRGVAFHGIDQR